MEGTEESKSDVDVVEHCSLDIEAATKPSSNHVEDILIHPQPVEKGFFGCVALLLRHIFCFLCSGDQSKLVTSEDDDGEDLPRLTSLNEIIGSTATTKAETFWVAGMDVYTRPDADDEVPRLGITPARMSFHNEKLIGPHPAPRNVVGRRTFHQRQSMAFSRPDGTPFDKHTLNLHLKRNLHDDDLSLTNNLSDGVVKEQQLTYEDIVKESRFCFW